MKVGDKVKILNVTANTQKKGIKRFDHQQHHGSYPIGKEFYGIILEIVDDYYLVSVLGSKCNIDNRDLFDYDGRLHLIYNKSNLLLETEEESKTINNYEIY